MLRAQQIFKFLEGNWTLSRTIPGFGKAEGHAKFTKVDENTLHYREDGTIRSPEFINNFWREYMYRFVDGKIHVFYNEPKNTGLLHTLEFSDVSSANGLHQCEKDCYAASYHFDLPKSFTLSYRVTGPKKDYLITTTFQKHIS